MDIASISSTRGNAWSFRCIALIALVLLTGCTDTDTDTPGQDSNAAVGLSPPSLLLTSRAIDPADLALNVMVDGEVRSAARNGDVWTLTLTGNPGERLMVDIIWEEMREIPLQLYRYSTQIVFSENTTITVSDDLYDSDIDDDRDNATNLEEALADTDPLNSNSCPGCRTDVNTTVRRVPVGSESPVVDGSYDSVWNMSQFKDQTGELLIDTLKLDDRPAGSSGDSPYRWATLHDENFLYVMVFGRTDEQRMYISDSDDAFNDESVEIFIGGDPSTSGTMFDGNDFQMIIPLSTKVLDKNASVNTDSLITTGLFSATLPQIDFATCLCKGSGSDIWEVAIPLAAVGIVPGQIFGIDVQVNLDVGGGDRNVKWGWSNPPGADQASTNPGLFGSAILE